MNAMRGTCSPTDLLNIVTLLSHYKQKNHPKFSATRHAETKRGGDGSPDVRRSSYLNPILLYPAKFAYQRETGLSQLERVFEERT